jgi:hypothetical protein
LPKIVTINDYAFWKDSLLNKITDDSNATLESIGSYAFGDCISLSTLSTTGKVTNIDDWAFFGCSSLKSAVFQATSITIGKGAFYNCLGLPSVYIPYLTTIPYMAFTACVTLKSLYTPNVTKIENTAFESNSSLKSIDFPLVTSVGKSAFTNCSSLSSIDLPLVTSVGDYAFNKCSSLSSISLPKVTSIGADAFSGCSSISYIAINDLTILNAVTENSLVVSKVKCDNSSAVDIPDNAFKNFYYFSSFDATNSVKSFGKYSFYNSKLETLPSISSTSCEIDAFALAKCTKLTSIMLAGTTALTVYEDAFAGIGYIDELTLPLNTTFKNSNVGTEYKLPRYNPFLGDSFGSVTFAGTKVQFNAIQTRDAPKFGLTSLFPVGTTITCSDGNITITA